MIWIMVLKRGSLLQNWEVFTPRSCKITCLLETQNCCVSTSPPWQTSASRPSNTSTSHPSSPVSVPSAERGWWGGGRADPGDRPDWADRQLRRGGSPAPYRGLLPDQEVDQQEELLAFQVGLLAVLQGLQQPEMMTTLLNTSCDRGRWWEEGGWNNI